jgi:transitional endoplasmic reticulum ATPase
MTSTPGNDDTEGEGSGKNDDGNNKTNNDGNANGIQLKLLEAKPKDVGKGEAHIDHAVMDKLKLKSGDFVFLIGKKTSVAIAQPGYYEDVGSNTVRIDGNLRRNIDIAVGETIRISKADLPPAQFISFSLVQQLRIKGGEEYLKQILLGRCFAVNDLVEINIMGRRLDLVISSFKPDGAGVYITPDTTIKIGTEKVTITPGKDREEISVPRIIYEDIGGLDEAVRKVREMIELPLRYPELFERLGVEAPKGVLLHGPPGTGKTLLAKAVASETKANFLSIGGPEIMSKFYGESEERLRKIFTVAEKNAPSIIFIDEIDSIAPKRDEVSGEVERRVVAQLLSLLDGLTVRGKVVIIGATNRPNALDPALRRPGRFDREINIGIPDRNGRLEILQIHTRGMPLEEEVDLENFANLTHGYVGADLAALCKEAAMNALRRILPDIDLEMESIPVEILNKIIVTPEDFLNAFRELEPSALREVLIECPNIHWDQIGGLEEPKQQIIESVEWPLKYPDLFKHHEAKPPLGILLYGPPGTGKTMLAKAVATETQANFISIKGPEIYSRWLGESEKAVREIFRKAKQASPCIIFFDEIDSIAPIRGSSGSSQSVERVVSQLLTEMDGLEKLHNIVVIAATNRPDIIDPALLRPGRFDRLIYIGTPGEETRREIFKIHTNKERLSGEVDLNALAQRTENYTGADIAAVCNEARMLAIRELIKSMPSDKKLTKNDLETSKIKPDHFDGALNSVKPTSKELLNKYTVIAEKFGISGPS